MDGRDRERIGRGLIVEVVIQFILVPAVVGLLMAVAAVIEASR